jgi:glycine/D-amino acid oxidase-like deaminating enzyme
LPATSQTRQEARLSERVFIAGAGMAGLCAAARARQLGLDPVVFEKGTRAGGSMLLSSCVVWRHQTLDGFREECPGGDPVLQQLIVERLDDALAWLKSLGALVVWEETENPRTTGKRFDPRELTDLLVQAAGDVRLETPFEDVEPLVLATGGFPVWLARERGLLVRSNPWSEGEGLSYGLAREAGTAGDMEEYYGRVMPAPPARIDEEDFVRLSQLWDGEARVVDEEGEEFFPGSPAWHESDLAQALGRQPGGTGWFIVPAERRDDPRVVGAREAGGEVLEEDGDLRLHVAAAVTHTLGGLRVDTEARVLRADGSPVGGLYAAGVDAGGIATGGYSSGLAQALVLGLAAAESLAL